MGESRQSGPGTLRLMSLASQPHRLRPNNPTITRTTSHTTPRTPTRHNKPLQFIYTDTHHRNLGSCSLRSSQRSSLQLRDFQYPSSKSWKLLSSHHKDRVFIHDFQRPPSKYRKLLSQFISEIEPLQSREFQHPTMKPRKLLSRSVAKI